MSRPPQKMNLREVGPELLARFKNQPPGLQREPMLAIKLPL